MIYQLRPGWCFIISFQKRWTVEMIKHMIYKDFVTLDWLKVETINVSESVPDGNVFPRLYRWHVYLLSYGYGSIPIHTIFRGWTSIYQLFWGSLGTRVLTHPHIFFVQLFYLEVTGYSNTWNPGMRQATASGRLYGAWVSGLKLQLSRNIATPKTDRTGKSYYT